MPELIAITDDAEQPDAGEESAALKCDQRLGRYRLCFEVAHGGMATVYLARADGPGGFGKLVALKRIHPHLARETAFVNMFLDEARIASQLSHPNVCGVTDFGQADDTYYLTMEYLVGESLGHVHHKLAQRERESPIADLIPIACRIVADACEGLHSAHELKGPLGKPLSLVHRDISPHNLFVAFDGSTKVVDFGIASAAGRLHHTQAGMLKGKFPYMAPEMLEGKEIDRRADVWALGVVLWETIALRRLFRKKSDSETLMAVMHRPIPRLSEAAANVPPELDRIVEKALARNPDERYASARELGQDLSRFIAARRDPVTMLDVGHFMQQLFPDGLAKKQQLLEIARQVEDGVIPSIAQSDDPTATLSMRSVSASVSRVVQTRSRALRLLAFAAVSMLSALLVAALFRDPKTTSAPRAGAAAQAAAQGSSPPQSLPRGRGELTGETPPRSADPLPATAPTSEVPVAAEAAEAKAPAQTRSRVRSAAGSARNASRGRAERIYRRD